MEGFEGLTPEVEDHPTSSPFTTGEVVTSQSTKAMEGTATVLVLGATPAELSRNWVRLRGMFSRRHDRTGVWTITRDDGQHFSARVRLARTLPPAERLPSGSPFMRVPINLRCDEGVWRTDTHTGQGQVTVVNDGDEVLYPTIRWSGNGGQVTLPSTATLTLPALPAGVERRLLLDNDKSLAVIDNEGHLDRTVWPILGTLPEGVAPDTSGTFTLPAGAQLEWSIPVHDPWGY